MTAEERILLEDVFGFTLTDICSGAVERLSAADKERLAEYRQRLANNEPVQYVTHRADFCGNSFYVAPGVLIPRPETEQLVDIVGYYNTERVGEKVQNILDIGTGSGCIAITIALQHPEWNVTAWDISADALAIARKNAKTLNASLAFEQKDALHLAVEDNGGNMLWNAIVSNPPYICQQEAAEMESNVLDYEPHLALFVPDEDPLLFYRAIMQYAEKSLVTDGLLAFEINPLYASSLCEMLENNGFHNIMVHRDMYDKERFVSCRK